MTPRAYSALLKRLSKLRRSGKTNAWIKLADKMHLARQKMIRANSCGCTNRPRARYRGRMPADFKRQIVNARRTKQGKKALAKYKRFWGLPAPTSIFMLPGDGKKKVTWIAGFGDTPEVHLSSAPRGKKGQRTLIRGRWKSGMLPDGRIVILSPKRKLTPPLRFVGFAPETHYVPTRAMENAGTFKRFKHWRHKHHDNGGKWPRVFADRNGRVDKNSNFVYARGTYRISKEGWLDR